MGASEGIGGSAKLYPRLTLTGFVQKRLAMKVVVCYAWKTPLPLPQRVR